MGMLRILEAMVATVEYVTHAQKVWNIGSLLGGSSQYHARFTAERPRCSKLARHSDDTVLRVANFHLYDILPSFIVDGFNLILPI